MDNDAPCKSVDIGFVQIKMLDGIVRTLTKGHHVLELKKNLVSVGAMDLKGFSFQVKCGAMQIKGKGKSMLMQGTKQGNLYII